MQDFIDKYRMYCEDWVERTTEMNQTEFLGAGIIKETGDGAIASLKDLARYTNMSSEEASVLIDEINALREAEGMEPIQLIGRDQVEITQDMLDSITSACDTAEQAQAAIVDLSKTEGVSFESGVTYNGKTVEDILAESVGDGSNTVSVDVQLSINDQEVISTITTTAATIEGILGTGWEAKIDSTDAEERMTAIQTLADNLVEGSYTVTIGENTSAASTALETLSALLDEIAGKTCMDINVNSHPKGRGS